MALKVLVDVNVCLDVLLDRKPFVEYSGRIFELGEKQEINLFISGLSFDTLFYVMKPALKPAKITRLLTLLLKHIQVADVNTDVVKKALAANWNDLEDALQYFSAVEASCKYLITRNTDDFKHTSQKTQVLTPINFLGQF